MKAYAVNNERLIAATILKNVVENKTPLPIALNKYESNAWIQNTSYTCTRHWFELSYIVNTLISKPFRKKDSIAYFLLIVGICQIRLLRTPDHVAVDSCVKAAKKTKLPWAASLINATLKNYLKKPPSIEEVPKSVRYNHPEWLIRNIEKFFPKNAEEIFQANNTLPPYVLRINTAKVSVFDFEKLLDNDKIKYSRTDPEVPSAIVIEQSIATESIPGFKDGLFFVQDISPQLSAYLLDINPQHKVLDACAAPGGKTSLLSIENENIDLTAIDVQTDRIDKLKANLERLQITDKVRVLQRDLTDSKDIESIGFESFDRILLDAPCSATGIIRRQPDIKVIKDYEHVIEISKTSEKILYNSWKLLKPGGKLLFATCSIMKRENQNQIKAFLEVTPEAKMISLQNVIKDAIDTEYGMQIIPGSLNRDGFFYSLIEKHI